MASTARRVDTGESGYVVATATARAAVSAASARSDSASVTLVNGIGGWPGRRGPRGYVPARSAAATRMIRLRYERFMATSASRPVIPARYSPASSRSGDDGVGSRYSSSAASATETSSVRTGASGTASTAVSMSRNMSARVGRSTSSSDHVVGLATM